MRILIIGLDDSFGESKEAGHQVDVVDSYQDAKYLIEIRNYDLILANDELEDGKGIELINQVKRKKASIACIILSSKSNKASQINAFKKGADDFVTIPYDKDILLARIESKLRFGGSNTIEIDDLIIDPDEEKIIYKNKEVDLKGKPFEVLTHLAKQKEQIVSKEQLLDAIWEEPELVTPNVIEVAINQIRQKIDKPLGIATIETVRRKGYRFCYPNPPSL